jgi:hypothetical protein
MQTRLWRFGLKHHRQSMGAGAMGKALALGAMLLAVAGCTTYRTELFAGLAKHATR